MTQECTNQGKRHSNARAHSSKRVTQIMEADNVKRSRPTYDGRLSQPCEFSLGEIALSFLLLETF